MSPFFLCGFLSCGHGRARVLASVEHELNSSKIIHVLPAVATLVRALSMLRRRGTRKSALANQLGDGSGWQSSPRIHRSVSARPQSNNKLGRSGGTGSSGHGKDSLHLQKEVRRLKELLHEERQLRLTVSAFFFSSSKKIIAERRCFEHMSRKRAVSSPPREYLLHCDRAVPILLASCADVCS